MKRYLPLLMLLCLALPLLSQNTLNINGLNEATFTYRTAEDSLNAYFSDIFSFNLAYRDFGFGMKFKADLPKYSTQQSELLNQLEPNRLELGWKELYVSYSKDAYTFFAGTTEETFGNGITFRSYQDLEFNDDNRMDSFLFKYDNKLQLKALYGAIENPSNSGVFDLAYGADALYPLMEGLKLGASEVAYRNYTPLEVYNQRDVFGGRFVYTTGTFDLMAEYAGSELYKQPGIPSTPGSAIYANGSVFLGSLSLGGAYKKYDKFQYRLHDLPTLNYHNETLSDASATGEDEEGFQTFGNYAINEFLSLNVDYAEAWNEAETLNMNDAYAALDWVKDNSTLGLSYAHIEKLDKTLHLWQQELLPAAHVGLPIGNKVLQIKGEYKIVTKQKQAEEIQHFEPKIQADISLAKLSLSLGAQSNWEEPKEAFNSRYWAAVEAKYPLASHSDIVVFAGKEAGGKVCRNGVCRYVAPFQGLKVELSTRF